MSDSASSPATSLRLILIEDQDDDATLVERTLARGGFAPAVTRAQTRAEFLAALDGDPDVVISDYRLPRFSPAEALACLRERGQDLPFIVVSGTIDEESAVGLLRAGAHDFVTKQNLARLAPAVRRELNDAANRIERRRMQQALDAQRDFLRLVIDANPSLIFTKDARGVFTLVNRALANLYGTTPDALEGRTHDEWGAGRPAAEFLTAERRVLATGTARYVAEEPITDARTGARRWVETRLVPLVLPDGSPQVLGIATEITERRQAEEALRLSEEQFRQAQKMEAVGQLAGGIAHDFNNLLTAILGYSDLMAERLRSMPDLAADLEEIRKAGRRAGSLTQQLLGFGRKQVLDPQLLDVAEVVTGVQKMLVRVLHENILVEIVTAESLPLVRADRVQLEQVLLNLAINARDAMPGGGTLRLEVTSAAAAPGSDPERWVVLAVSDTGSGMPPEVRERVFEPFFTTKPPGKGTGLGLSMVHGVVTQSGGRIAVESQPGRGTRFLIHLPAALDAGKAAPPPPARPVVRRGTETILLVEDERPVRLLVRKVLAAHGYAVLDAESPEHAIRIAGEYPGRIHLLLSDIVMPGLNGPEMAQQIVPSRPDIRVLYMSGFGSNLATRLGRTSAGVSLLAKPFTPERLVAKVRERLDMPVPVETS